MSQPPPPKEPKKEPLDQYNPMLYQVRSQLSRWARRPGGTTTEPFAISFFNPVTKQSSQTNCYSTAAQIVHDHAYEMTTPGATPEKDSKARKKEIYSQPLTVTVSASTSEPICLCKGCS